MNLHNNFSFLDLLKDTTVMVFIVPLSAGFDFIEVSFYSTAEVIDVEKEDCDDD
jgi:hypothetical protein